MRGAYLTIGVGLLLIVSLVHAQECSAVFEAALEAVDTLCNATERNRACYGHALLQATPQNDGSDFQFETPGDSTQVTAIDTLTLSAMTLRMKRGV